MRNEIQTYRNLLERQKGQKIQIEQSITTLNQELRDANRDLRRHEQAREIIREVGIKTQQQLSFHISDITSLALEAVFNEPYELKVEFVQRRNKTECDLYFERNGERIDPLTASGGGAVDMAAFALRIASWSMLRPHTRNVIILDEPLRFLSVDLQERASIMIKEISEKLGIQFILVTHNDTLTSYADRTFQVSIKKGVSKVITT
jgi:DNA repair exonuclease SbcCD ATPase subunit